MTEFFTKENHMKEMYDVAIIGGGPAGLTAALYLARAKYRVLVIEKETFGGQITITSEVVNYPGIPKISGILLTDHMRNQAENFGAEFLLTEVTRLHVDQDVKILDTDKGQIFCFGILIASGAHPRMVGFQGEEMYKGHGVAYCATCDGEFFTGKEVFVVGGGYAAAEESVFLTKYASHVTVLVREKDFTCAKTVADPVKNHEKITVHYETEVVEVYGDQILRGIKYKNNDTGEVQEYIAPNGDTFGVFVFVGYAPATELVRDLVQLDEYGYIQTDHKQKTSLEGIYGAGDVCAKPLRQVVTAVGDGALAATELERYAHAMQNKTGIKPEFPLEKTSRLTRFTENNDLDKSNGLRKENEVIFAREVIEQMNQIFERMEQPLLLELHLDQGNRSTELDLFIKEMTRHTSKLKVQQVQDTKEKYLPYVRICHEDGTWSGLSFHGVPGGHEFTSFMLGLYNVAGPGQPISQELVSKIQSMQKSVHMRILVSLSCTMCPDLVIAAQRIASLNELVQVEVFDLNRFPELKEQYQVMSVPCYIINKGTPLFGKKNIEQLLTIMLQE